MGLVVNPTPLPLYPRQSPGTHCIRSWVGPRAGLDGCGKSRPQRAEYNRAQLLDAHPQPGFKIYGQFSGKPYRKYKSDLSMHSGFCRTTLESDIYRRWYIAFGKSLRT
jgi:hypothetical protein